MQRKRNSGFTLLEVMVALTIAAVALGSLYSVIAGSKRLAWRAETALAHAVQARSHINYTQLTDEQGELEIDLGSDKMQLTSGEKLTEPKRKTRDTSFDLRSYEIKDEHGDLVAEGSYWIHQQLPVGANGGQNALDTGAGGVGVGAPGGLGGQGRGRGGRNGNGANGGRNFPGGGNGNFPGGRFPGGNGNFPGGRFPGGNGNFPGGRFPQGGGNGFPQGNFNGQQGPRGSQ
ncbi:MAG TPA: prepilin-type N-terminal cleavage/methylation domain-containing protein [Candidatus Acidoferrum sp.]|nr:prepilin-type N-terminal cleavage/methylation domain-containing protein [Candidatus Acidoferrum sp.]